MKDIVIYEYGLSELRSEPKTTGRSAWPKPHGLGCFPFLSMSINKKKSGVAESPRSLFAVDSNDT